MAAHPRHAGPAGSARVENRSADSLDLWVNGEQVFVRGVVWTPGDLAALDTAVELGFNLVRVSGISAYESDEFYRRCDELGLMVWQDLMFATLDYPLADEGFRATVEAEVRDQLARLEEHPSVVVVCGSAEHEQQAAMFGVSPATGYAARAGVVPAPAGRASPASTRSGWTARPAGETRSSGSTPGSRSTSGSAPTCATCRTPGTPGCGSPPSAWPSPTCPTRWSRAACRRTTAPTGTSPTSASTTRAARYGAEATEAERQRVTGEVMADVFGEWRRPDSVCGGGIVLWLRDLEPGAGWGLLDHTGTPKPAALALAPTLQPTAVWFVDEGLNGLDVHVAHDPGEPVDLALTVELLREDGSVLESAEQAWTMEPHGHRRWTVDALLGRFADSSYAYRFGPPPHAAVRARLTGDDGVNREAVWRVHCVRMRA